MSPIYSRKTERQLFKFTVYFRNQKFRYLIPIDRLDSVDYFVGAICYKLDIPKGTFRCGKTKFRYIDSYGDLVTVVDNEDLSEAVHCGGVVFVDFRS